jgi:outer membrane lipoprotein SlyB
MAPTTPGMLESAVVTSIEAMRGSSGASGTGTTSQGTSGTAGASGTGQMYRITLRMDDGSTRVLMQDWAPGFKSGDRVNVQNGAIQMKR